MTDDGLYRKIAASAPINRQAGLALARGEEFVSKKKIVCAHWSEPPPTTKPPVGTTDRKGCKFGRLTVVGYSHTKRNKTGRDAKVWVVRCVCGAYETRTSKSIDNPNNCGDRCQNCRQLLYLQKEEKRKLNPNVMVDMHKIE